jgi:hypothetical protein
MVGDVEVRQNHGHGRSVLERQRNRSVLPGQRQAIEGAIRRAPTRLASQFQEHFRQKDRVVVEKHARPLAIERPQRFAGTAVRKAGSVLHQTKHGAYSTVDPRAEVPRRSAGASEDLISRLYAAVCPELPGCASAGDTEEEARVNIREAIALYLAPADIELPENAKLVEVTAG